MDRLQAILHDLKSGRIDKAEALRRLEAGRARPAAAVSLLAMDWREQRLGTPCGENRQRLLWACEQLGPVDAATPLCAGQADAVVRFETYAAQLLAALKDLPVHGPEVLVQVAVPAAQETLFGLSGLLLTAQLENPRLRGQVIGLEGVEDMATVLRDEGGQADALVRYRAGVRSVMVSEECALAPAGHPWRDGGVYLITGGAGGLGMLFARDILRHAGQATVILAGRSSQPAQRLPASLHYRQIDVADATAVSAGVRAIREEFGTLNGILHCAGVLRDGYLRHKSAADLRAVLAPKVRGLVNLDQASDGVGLDLFVAFSSLAGVAGNVGQADYAAANAFMDRYAAGHARLLSINWPLWADGGMRVDAATADVLRESMGLAPLATQDGLLAFYRAVAGGARQVLVVAGDSRQIGTLLRPPTCVAEAVSDIATGAPAAPAAVLAELKALFAATTRFPAAQLDAFEPLSSYGIDSIMITRLNQKLGAVFGALPKTLLYEYRTLAALADYLCAHHPAACRQWRAPAGTPAPLARPAAGVSEPIAIIGISGRYPQARTLAEYWDNLKAGRDCIAEIPDERWPLQGFFEPDHQLAVAQGKSYSKWGGFIDGFAEFDPLFFGISPREAEGIDPQERLFIQACWEVLEDAALTRETIASRHRGRVGVFAGITKSGFSLYGPELWRGGETLQPRTSFSSLANRVSYLFNLNGPSLPVDTMCSSSLTAVHQACEALRHGDCELAIAGGVNLYLHPSSYVELCAAHMLSADGRCKSFGRGGDGFVPGEGVGCVLLKPLARAIADGDPIHAVIRATQINHGGKTNGYTVPNPAAQRELIRATLDKAGIDARSIGYVEAHGTGTEMGDPIEIAALTEAFRVDTADSGYCAIGSSKSNIGHLEAAAGIAGLTRIVLQFRHRQLAPSLHAAVLNPHIDFAHSPFCVQQQLTPWQRGALPLRAAISSFGAGGANAHVLLEEYVVPGTATPPPRPAAVLLSARGEAALRDRAAQLLAFLNRPDAAPASTLTAALRGRLAALLHVDPGLLEGAVPLEEYGVEVLHLLQLQEEFGFDGSLQDCPTIDAMARRVAPGDGRVHLADLAYTLQTGREAMPFRLGCVATSVADLTARLAQFLSGDASGVQLGRVSRPLEAQRELDADPARQRRAASGDLAQMLELWLDGQPIDWAAGHAGAAPRRISLPTYPFARNRYWIGDRCRRSAPVPVAAAPAAGAAEQCAGDEFIVQTIIDKLNATLGLAPGELRPDQSFADYGLDSILGVNLVHELNEAFGIALETTCLFDYSSVDKLSARVRTLYRGSTAPAPAAASDAARGGDEAIAIIGISGRFPKSDKLPQLWRHLADGRDLVEPVTRWSLPDDGGCRHGGFVDGIDQFDALFFNISGLEASYMDPQQRLFLQESWQALEDAGYAGAAVAGSACGVYVGCCAGDYQDLFLGQPSAQSLWGNMAAVIPSRIAYYLDLKGPALAIDTACSSSLVAIDLACKDLRNGEVAMALAGGVFLQATPKLYTAANRAGMLSASGHCHAFDAAADGFVPGEGAGVLLLKRLADAEADGDHIYGVIRASGVNQDGTTNGITAPSARSQEALLRRIYDCFGIDAARIRMVEAHGTGTRLGDPIEFGALSKAFRADSGRRQYCALGSVKTNIGHSQYAAGVAGVLKVVLALQHRQIPPSLHFHVGNPAIDFADSPFFVNTTLLPWPEGGRLAAVSSFGAGGTNAHLVIGEAPVSLRRHASMPAYLVVLSARSERQLRQQAEQLLAFCRQTPTLDLGNLSFTLIGGRKHFEYRLAVVVGNLDELCAALAAPRLQAPLGRTRQAAATRLWQQCVERLPGAPDYRSELENLAEAYLDGAGPSCAGLFGDGHCRLPLPTYPFARDRYWIAETALVEPVAVVHPLLQRKLGDRCFGSRFAGSEFFLADHQVQGRSIMPGVLALEMARAALAAELGRETGIRLRDVVWIRPLAGQAPEIRITLDPVAGGPFEFRIGAADDPQRVYSQGLVEAMTQAAPQQDLVALRAACTGRSVTRDECYAALRATGIEHGERLQAVQEIDVGAGLAVARLALPNGAAMPVVLHPSLLDAAIQAAVALLPEPRQTALPFAMHTLEVFAPCAAAMSAVIRRNATPTLDKYDIDLCDERGQVCVRMVGYSARVLETGAPAEAALSVLLQPVWDAQELPPAPLLTGRMLVIGASPAVLRQLQRFAPQLLELGIDDSVAQIAARLAALDTFDHLLWVGGAAATLEQPGWHEHGVLRAFRLIKALLGAGHDALGLHWTLITSQCQPISGSDPVLPADAALHGLFGSLAKEYPNWRVRIADVEIGVEWPLEAIFGLPFDARGDAWVWRRRQWHRRQLVPLKPTDSGVTGYRQGGVYVVIGGAGGVGAVWTDYVVRRYQASVIWIGRSRPDAALQARIDAFGGAVHYVSADATDHAALAAARAQIERAFGPVHGVVHSAIVLLDQSLARMDEQRFLAAYRAKATISVCIGEVFGQSRLDFVLFFSSIQSFARMPGQSNYAAGCTFKDAFACYLGQHGSTPVKVINWGYWGQVGIVAGEQYQQRMAQAGLASIEAPAAMAALETLLGGGAGQLALVRSTRLAAVDGINNQQSISVYPQTLPSCLGRLEQAIPSQQIQVDALRATVGAQMSDMDVLLARLLFAQLREIGLFAGQGIAAMQARLPPLYARWFDESLVVLIRHGWIDSSAVVLRSIDATAAWADWEHAKAPWLLDDNRRAQVLLVDTMLRALPDILNQKRLATDAMFPDSSLRLVEGIYKNNLVADYFNAILSEVLLAYLGQRLVQDPKARIRILEIGAGTGGTSALVLKKLSRYRDHLDEYCYTDLSKAFLMHAQREYGPGNPYLTYQRFDVGQPLADQQIAAGAFDVVIASNVLHATRNIRTTLRNAKAALRRNGLLLLNELSDNVLFSHLTFGLLEGWWLYDDAALRIPGSPGLSPQSWKSVLADEGFGLVTFPAAAAHGMGQQIIVAESDGVVRQATPYRPEASGEPLRSPSVQAAQKPAEAAPVPTGDLVRDKARSYFRELVGETIRIPASEIEACEPLERYGIDSILVVQLTSRLRSVLPDISSTLFFEVQSIDGLIEHLLATQPTALAALLDVATPCLPPAPSPPPSQPLAAAAAPVVSVRSAARSQDIAIIGLAGRYPQAGNVERFWQNIREGRNCITEIPPERWNWRDYFDPEPGKSGAMYSRFGGFLEDIGHFDPLFFHLSPAEAERMDPQERLFLLQAYSAIEDAGYTPQSLGGQRKVGVFVGVMNGRYPTGAAFWSVANRVSYLLNLTGPSLSVDTACSSSLTALHLALESINSGMSDCAIAGGVNLILDPQHLVTLSEMVMLSPSDECRSFGAQADGFIDGEGVGALVLKPLADALAAGDHVYGIVRGSAINAGGKTNSYTVPSPVAQARVVSEACARAGVAPRTISYIEAHGTGTALGDPIEIAGLTRAFRASTEDRQFCAVGSVKSNIGHCESAAGLAGITKVLMQFRHAQLAPSLHADSLNPEIDFANSPFTLQRTLGPWPRPLIEGREYPRRAGISSFGAGGANAHVVLEEFDVPERAAAAAGPRAIVLSAKNDERLRVLTQNLLSFLETHPDTHLADLAFTLQVGRVAMDHRLALVADSLTGVQEHLRAYLDGGSDAVYRGQISGKRDALAACDGDSEMRRSFAAWAAQGQYDKLLPLWVQGANLDWSTFGIHAGAHRISLPTYPFAAEHYWMARARPRADAAASFLHPLVQTNSSDLDGLRFTSTFSGGESFLADHRVQGRRVLPGVAYLEMARVAVIRVVARDPDARIVLSNVVWERPFVVEEGQSASLHISLSRQPDGSVAFRIHSDAALHSHGRAQFVASPPAATLDLSVLQARMTRARFSAEQCYAAFASLGIAYGPTHRGLKTVYAGSGEALARLDLPATADACVLPPGLLDSALQASLALLLDSGGALAAPTTMLPFALGRVEVLAPCTAAVWAWVAASDGTPAGEPMQKLDITLCDAGGQVCARLLGFAARCLSNAQVPAPAAGSLTDAALKQRTGRYLKGLLAKATRLAAERIAVDTPLEEYGLDSVMVIKLTSELEKTFGALSKTLFFEHRHLDELADYFVTAHAVRLRTLFGVPDSAAIAAAVGSAAVPLIGVGRTAPPVPSGEVHDVAIIGLSGRYPMAASLEQFWANLRDGVDCITEVPVERWDHRRYYHPDRSRQGATNSKWGGFLDSVDQFDPLFFNISPRDAEIIDPQERLFLEGVYHAIEDAGYTRHSLTESGNNVGVYVGVMYEEYQLYGAEQTALGRPMALSGSPSSIANRVSYFFDLNGPSMAVDSMCSSSLTAIHLACQALQQGDCSMAIAGGVNLTLHPNKYLALGQGRFASSQGRCKSFGEGGDGYVPSEGVGVLLLKPLAQAIADGDHIYGVVKGSAINHGGKTNAYTVPNPQAQAGVIARAYARAGIAPRTVSYVEAHGTGTALGDPIEIAGLSSSFRDGTPDTGFCAIGSVKSNIGHCESAAGVAGVTKVLLQLKHRQLAPSLHAATLNANIDFDSTPFVVQQHLGPWQRPRIEIDGALVEVPLRAGVSSFGAGGSNAHLIIEEYVAAPPAAAGNDGDEGDGGAVVVVLSARTTEQLTQLARKLLGHLEAEPPRLRELAYTLQLGREAMDERFGLVVSSLAELRFGLRQFLDGSDATGTWFRGNIKAGKGALSAFRDEDLQGAIAAWVDKRKYDKLLELWVQGLPLDWRRLYGGQPPARISLPVYPFARARYWIPGTGATLPAAPPMVAEHAAVATPPSALDGVVLLHPCWRERALASSGKVRGPGRQLVLCCGGGSVADARFEVIDCAGVDSGARFAAAARRVFEVLQGLLQEKPRSDVLLQVVVPLDGEGALFAALTAMLKTAQLENPRIRTQLIAISGPESGSEALTEILQTESTHPHAQQVRYRAGRRQVLEHVELPPAPVLAHPWRDKGVYLITGGAGALGLIFARDILRQAPRATVILSGRAAAVSLPASAAGMVYRQMDVADAEVVERMLASIGREFGSLTGILHSAGVLRDSYLLKKSRADLDAVLAAKVRGLVNLDLASRALPLELFVAFSSLAGVTGNPGQADYASANSFMDHYVAYRNTLVTRGERAGRSLALNWPLWAEGGMRPDPASVQLMRDRFGLSPLASESGIAAFYQALASGHDQVLIAAGERGRLLDLFDARGVQPGSDAAALLPEAACDLGDRVRAMLRQHAADLIKVGTEVIEPDVALSEYGYDSVTMTELANKLNDAYDLELTPTLCFEYPSIAAMAGYLLGAHPAVFARRFAPRTVPPRQPPAQRERPPAAARPAPLPGASAPIAVVGISGCMPMAVDLDAFWANLVAERDCISEIPASRWDWKALDGDPEREPNPSNVRWGGFIDGIDEFDPLFFGISPREAEVMDPPQRLLMMHVWKALEDAGHAPESLSGSRTALFVGTGASGYHTLFSATQRSMEGYSATASVPSIGPNRMSYLLNLRGPSEPIETACSSSLVAVIRGVSVLRDGSCDLAIVGGINTIITPEAHISFDKAGMLSPDGRCKPFSQQANGYARGEGVGMLVLKRLSDAEAAGDHIHGVILGCAENHGGRATSLTAPNPQAQAELLRDAYRRAGIDPRTISYVEAHGTGTRLGDPVEIAGLKAAFGESGEQGFCGLGSVKSNIGHLELAAGVAGMLKVLLQMRHKTLVKSLHSEQLNPYFDLADSPFYVVQQTAPWLAQRDAQGHPLPRRAGVSSFGFGGVNAHVLLEEYIPSPPPVVTNRPALIVLSARNEERLLEVVSNLLAFLNRAAEPGPAWLASLACTLQLGRDAMEERLAWSVTTVTELIGNLQAFVARGALGGGMRGQVRRHKEALSVLAADEDAAALIDAWVAKGKTLRLLELWTKGLHVGWERLYGAGMPPRLRLPTYPFARERYWAAPAATRPAAAGGSLLHPLLHANTSDFNAQRFTSRFSGQESFLADHRVQGQRVLPGVAYLEMARAAISHSLRDCPGLVLNHVVWARPFVAGDTPPPLDVVLSEQNDGRIAFAIQSAAEEAVIHCQGVAEVSASGEPAAVLDLPAVQQRMLRGQLSGAQCYGAFAGMGIDYGPGHRAIAALHVGAGEVLARLSLPSLGAGFVLHPGMLDAAIQSSLGLLLDDHGRLDGAAAMLPFAVKRVDIAAPCTTEMWAVVATAGDGLDMALCDLDGRVCVRLSGFRTRPVEASAAPRPPGSVVEAPAGELHGQVRAALRQMVSALIKVNPTDIDLDSELSEYGFDSISLTELANRLNSEFDLELMPTLFFEFPSIVALAAHLVEAHPVVFARRFGAAAATPTALPPSTAALRSRRRHRTAAVSADTASEPIAIVGMSACLPMAADVDAFWDNLLAGRDCISEIPASRWDWRAVYGDPGREANRTNVKWGGFIDGVDQFDPLFFGITPREAEVMDPQQRLLMTHVWKAIEDAGYAAQTLSGSRTALFVGTGASSYGSLLARSPRAHDAFSSTAVVASMGPNRMSYFLNLHGPSEPIETACSSSLVALNRGVAVLRDGSCDMAIVGGVNTMVTPDAHISFSKAGMLSPDGRCKTFSPQANGYVRGEGVGMLVLKRLSDAEGAGDPIHGLIRACAENHGGRASSLTAPNPLAQAALLRETYARAGIDPRSIGYIEAHGTGTRLGDPVEINGLKNAFGELGAQEFCGIGSVKSNIGHLELAAGVAGVIKVLLQMRHKTLVKSLHSEHISPYIELAGSPFYVVQETTPWPAQSDAQGRELPRRAGVSSFGFGGVNAHVLLEEYLPPAREAPSATRRPALIVLSARNEERLQEVAANLLACLRARPVPADDDNGAWLESLAYTLQVGREAMDERLGWVVSSLPELIDHLHAFVVDAALGSGVRAQVRRHRETLSLLADEDGASLLVDDWLARGKYTRLLEMWARGLLTDWQRLYEGVRPRRLNLPTYPFARERYWVDAPPLAASPAPPPASVTATDVRGRVVACVAELSGLPAAGFADDGDLHALGFDSVFLLQLAAALTREFPVLDRHQDGDALLCCSSIAALVTYIEQAGQPAPTATLLAFTPPARQGSEITAQVLRRDARNVLCEALRIEASEPPSLKARVVVDQSHPFLFDHPLDHISGLHLGAAMSEAVKVAHMHRYGLAPEAEVFVSTLALDFIEVCRKQPEALVHVAAASVHDEYAASVSQEGRVMVRASFAVQGGTPRPSAASARPPGLRPASPHTLNKRNEANVLLSEVQGGADRPGCWLLAPGAASFVTDFPGRIIDSVVLAEAARQGLRLFSASEPDQTEPVARRAAQVELLKTLEVSLQRPLYWDEGVYLELLACDRFEIGSAARLRIDGVFLVAGAQVGRFSASALSLSPALQQQWDHSGRARL